MLRLLLLTLLLAAVTHSHAQYFDTLHIHYDIGVAGLSAQDKVTLDSLAQHVGGRKMLIYSYADYLGSEKPNLHLSENRAMEVKQYLLAKTISADQIMECTGLGRVPGSGGSEGDSRYRRTDIFIRKEKSAASITPPQTATRDKVNTPKPVTVKELGDNPGVAKDEWEKEREENLLVGRMKPTDPRISKGEVTQINLDQLEVNQTLNLKNLLFYPGRAELIPSSYAEQENLYNVMTENPSLKIKLEGHVCCCVYPDGYFDDTPTWQLSVARAFVIYKMLVDRGIAPERMQYQGFGRTRPIREDEKTVEEGAVNRRVEIRILEK